MSVTESKAKAPVKTSKKSVNPAESAALKAALEAAQVEMVPLSALVKSPLNVRTIPIRLTVSGRWLTPSWRSA
jgi:ParB family chromosome partitioning protein